MLAWIVMAYSLCDDLSNSHQTTQLIFPVHIIHAFLNTSLVNACIHGREACYGLKGISHNFVSITCFSLLGVHQDWALHKSRSWTILPSTLLKMPAERKVPALRPLASVQTKPLSSSKGFGRCWRWTRRDLDGAHRAVWISMKWILRLPILRPWEGLWLWGTSLHGAFGRCPGWLWSRSAVASESHRTLLRPSCRFSKTSRAHRLGRYKASACTRRSSCWADGRWRVDPGVHIRKKEQCWAWQTSRRWRQWADWGQTSYRWGIASHARPNTDCSLVWPFSLWCRFSSKFWRL